MMENKKPDLSELNKLEEYLKTNGYNYRRRDEEPGEQSILYPRNWHQIKVYNNNLDPIEVAWDVICHYGSYGYEQGLLEIMNGIEQVVDTPDGVRGNLTAQDIINILEEDTQDTKKSAFVRPNVGAYECFNCGEYTVIWDSDFSFEDYGEEGDGLIHECHCANCGATITYRIPFDDMEEEHLEEKWDCDNSDITCEDCDHHMVVSWCGKAIAKQVPINKEYETGWMDGYSAKEEESPWILCEDDLPEMHDAGMLKKLGTQERSDKCLVTIECEGERVVDNDAELHDGEWYSSFIRFLKAGNKTFKVVAWMPMPKPYKE